MASAWAWGLLAALTTYAAHVWLGQVWGGSSRKAASSSTQRVSSETTRMNARRYLEATNEQGGKCWGQVVHVSLNRPGTHPGMWARAD